MTFPLEIHVRGTTLSPDSESFIRRCADLLLDAHPHASHCQVEIDASNPDPPDGPHYAVRIDVATPSGAIAVALAPASERPGFRTLIRNTFEAAERELSSQQALPGAEPGAGA
jgi:hypothetical protein